MTIAIACSCKPCQLGCQSRTCANTSTACRGAKLTNTDIEQHKNALHEDDKYRYDTDYPDDELKEGCLKLYGEEKAAGTELVAIIGRLREYVEKQEEIRSEQRRQQWATQAQQERAARENRLLIGADISWTEHPSNKKTYCRINGRLYHAVQANGPAKRWQLYRVKDFNDERGVRVGDYQNRNEGMKVLKKIAFERDIL
jgi:hypothetical protein